MKHDPLVTVGQVAKRLDVPIHVVAYLLRSRRIEPTARAGILRLYDEASVKRIAAEVERVARRNEMARPCEE